jgi:hypothetical protein
VFASLRDSSRNLGRSGILAGTGGLKPLSLVTFFAAAKKVTAAPHRGNASKPIRIRGCQRTQMPAKKQKTKNKNGDQKGRRRQFKSADQNSRRRQNQTTTVCASPSLL